MLTEKEMTRIDKLNKKSHYGLTKAQHTRLVNKYKAAIKKGDDHEIELIEYRLTDINFHTTVKLLEQGKFEEAINWY